MAACKLLSAEASIGDAVVGFHAQQAVEKSIRAILSQNGIPSKLDVAKTALDAAIKLAPSDPLVRYLSVRFLAGSGDAKGAKTLLETMVRDHQDGYAVRMRLADLAEKDKDTKTMRAHLQAARRWDPSQLEALQALYDLAKKEKRPREMLRVLRELAALDQHDRKVFVLLIEALAEAELWGELAEWGARAVFVDVHNPRVHQLYGVGLAKTNRCEEALFELETALLAKPTDDKATAAIYATMAGVYRDGGQADKAKQAAAKALELDPTNAEAKAIQGGR